MQTLFRAHPSDFTFLQEVDFNATRSYHVDEATIFRDANNPVPTCRNAHEPYEPGHTYVQTIDSFIVTDNISAEKPEVIDTAFLYSDHNPVIMQFKLNS